MARTLIGEVELRLRDNLTPGARAAADALRGVKGAADSLGQGGAKLDALSKNLKNATRDAEAFAKAMATGGNAAWGRDFTNNLARLKVPADEIARLKREFSDFTKMLAGEKRGTRADMMTAWKANALQAITDVRAAERALTKEAIQASKEKVAAETRAAADIAKAKTVAAREVAKQEREVAREAARAARTADREQAQSARELARERLSSAREAARAAREAARDEARAARVAVAAHREAQREAQGGRRRWITGPAGAVTSGVLMASGVQTGAGGVAQGARFAMQATAEQSSVRTQMRLAGMTPDEIAQVEQRSGRLSQQYRTLNVPQLMQIGQSLRSATGDVPKALQMMETFAQMSSVMSAVRGSADPQRDLEQFAKAIDIMGATTDVGAFRAAAQASLRAHSIERRDLPLSQYLNFARRSKGMAQSLLPRTGSDGQVTGGDFFNNYLPNLLQQAGGDSVGTSWHSLISQLIGGRGTSRSRQVRVDSGLATAQGGILDPALLMSEPHLWAQRHMVPALNREFARRGVQEQDAQGNAREWRWGQEMTPAQITAMGQFLSRAFSNGKAGEFFNIMMGQSDQMEKSAEMNRRAPGHTAAAGLTETDLRSASTSVIEQARNLVTQLMEPITGPLTSGFNSLGQYLSNLTQSAAGWTDVQKLAAAVATLTGTAAAGLGATAAGGALAGSVIRNGVGPTAGAIAGGAFRWVPGIGFVVGAGIAANDAGERLGSVYRGVEDGDVHNFGRTWRREAERRQRAERDARFGPLGEGGGGGSGETGGGFGGGLDGAFRSFGSSGASAGQAAGQAAGDGVAQGIAGAAPNVMSQMDQIMAQIRARAAQPIPVNVTVNATTAAGTAGTPASPPGRALGGPVTAGQVYEVGEAGPERFVPGANGSIIPNHALGGLGGGRSVRFSGPVIGSIQVSGGNAQEIMDQIGDRLKDALAGAFNDSELNWG